MKLSKYLADYIEHEYYEGEWADSTAAEMIDNIGGILEQGIEAFESTEASKVLVVSKKQRDKQVKEFIKGWGHFCDKINFGHSFLDARAIQWMSEVRLRIRELSE